LSFSPVTATQLKASKAAGGSALGIENETKGFLWTCYGDGSIPAVGALTDTRLFESSVIAAEAAPKSSRELPLYINYARVEQKPILSFRSNSLSKYRQIKKKYDPDNFITTHTSGHDFY
jgi:Berberine and berberine like